jgi:hypothetical protein
MTAAVLSPTIHSTIHASIDLLLSLGWALCWRDIGWSWFIIGVVCVTCASQSIWLKVLHILLVDLWLISHISRGLLSKARSYAYRCLLLALFVFHEVVLLRRCCTSNPCLLSSFVHLRGNLGTLSFLELEWVGDWCSILTGPYSVEIVVGTWLRSSRQRVVLTAHRLLFWIHVETIFACFILKFKYFKCYLLSMK